MLKHPTCCEAYIKTLKNILANEFRVVCPVLFVKSERKPLSRLRILQSINWFLLIKKIVLPVILLKSRNKQKKANCGLYFFLLSYFVPFSPLLFQASRYIGNVMFAESKLAGNSYLLRKVKIKYFRKCTWKKWYLPTLKQQRVKVCKCSKQQRVKWMQSIAWIVHATNNSHVIYSQ